jgi:chorismate-pyruvate lyase
MNLPVPALHNVRALYDIFDESALPEHEPIDAAFVPQPHGRLLAHEQHMTRVLEEHHGTALDLRILQKRHVGERYARKILLVSPRSQQAVMFAIMRFELRYCSPAVRAEIIEGQIPLGRILIEHNVLRRICPHGYVKITRSPELSLYFQSSPYSLMYGRLATIFCNEQPAVQLLEVVRPE